MVRAHQFVLIVSTLLGSWLGMQAVHELGHVAAANLTGGRVARVVLHPLSFSRTDYVENPHPLIVAWAGPIMGVLIPLMLWIAAIRFRLREAFVLRFFAGSCLLVNGLYIGFGSISRIGDCGELLTHGSRPWQLWLFAILTVPSGLALWHGQGKHFGLGSARNPIQPSVTSACLIVCLALFILSLVVGGK